MKEKRPVYPFFFSILGLLGAVSLLLAACQPVSEPAQAAGAPAKIESGCPVTRPPDPPFVPPAPSPAEPSDGQFWWGTPALWTVLPVDGRWNALPQDEHGFTQKTFFWREGYDPAAEPQPALTVTGRRLDGDAPTVTVAEATHGYHQDAFMLSGVVLPTAGCWEITGEYQGERLRYVVEVGP